MGSMGCHVRWRREKGERGRREGEWNVMESGEKGRIVERREGRGKGYSRWRRLRRLMTVFVYCY